MRKLFEVTINGLERAINESHNAVLDEVLSCKDSTGKWIKDFQKSDDSRFKGDSKDKRKERALAARYAKCEDATDGERYPLEQGDQDDVLYVEYMKDMTGESPFLMGGQKYQYVWAKYPSGKIDIGVYTFSSDLVYSYKSFRQMHNIT